MADEPKIFTAAEAETWCVHRIAAVTAGRRAVERELGCTRDALRAERARTERRRGLMSHVARVVQTKLPQLRELLAEINAACAEDDEADANSNGKAAELKDPPVIPPTNMTVDRIERFEELARAFYAAEDALLAVAPAAAAGQTPVADMALVRAEAAFEIALISERETMAALFALAKEALALREFEDFHRDEGFGSEIDALASPEKTSGPLTFSYRNHRGETSIRRVAPISVRFGSTEWHSEPQWLMRALDLDKGEGREFAMRDMAPCALAPALRIGLDFAERDDLTAWVEFAANGNVRRWTSDPEQAARWMAQAAAPDAMQEAPSPPAAEDGWRTDNWNAPTDRDVEIRMSARHSPKHGRWWLSGLGYPAPRLVFGWRELTPPADVPHAGEKE